ncbi:hypothetical protein LJC33_02040 [Eubacteriales bacterium OttesenSCG-928-N13]|nr:hypothetical protein [Eubacteriales bacterium OttesenSCG-928-N13]
MRRLRQLAIGLLVLLVSMGCFALAEPALVQDYDAAQILDLNREAGAADAGLYDHILNEMDALPDLGRQDALTEIADGFGVSLDELEAFMVWATPYAEQTAGLSAEQIEQDEIKISISGGATEGMVWIPTRGGVKRHKDPNCSGMKDPDQVAVQDAIDQNYEKCKKCWN